MADQTPLEEGEESQDSNEHGLQETQHDNVEVENVVVVFGDPPSHLADTTTNSQKYFLRWSRLSKTVQVQEANAGLMRGSIAGPPSQQAKEKGGGPVVKTILNQVSGYAAPGQVLAMIGPSGSGKTTLLNALSGRTSLDSGVISANSGVISTNRKSINRTSEQHSMKRFVSQVAYVQQEDIFFEHLTVRDQLAYTAFLRLPQAWARQTKLDEVNRTIKLLRLTKVQNSQIKLLSGGEKKRVNIGTELLTNPSCLLLDEPTSGLDSTSAVALVKLLQKLARSQQKTVLMSIHQPSSGMFLSFDSLLLLAEGDVVYFGSPMGSIQYLKEKDLACPEGYNGADHWMDLLVSDSAIEEEEEYTRSSYLLSSDIENEECPVRNRKSASRLRQEGIQASRRSTRQQLIDAWDSEAVAEQIDQAVQAQNEDETAHPVEVPAKYNTSWIAQYRVLIHRALKNSRSAIFTPLNMIRSALLGTITGLLWFQLEYTEKTVHDRTSYFFFTMTYWVFDSMFGAILAFPAERKVILKERASASYHLSAYFMAKTTSEAPTRLTLPLLYMTISFWLAGISNQFSLFVFTTLICLLSVLAGESYGLLIGASVDKADRAMTCVTVVALTMMLLGGFYVDNIPGFVAWLKYLSPFKYAFDASREIVFDSDVPCDGSGELKDLCSDGQESVSPEDLKEFLDIDGSLPFNIGMLIVLGFVPRYFAYLAMKYKKKVER